MHTHRCQCGTVFECECPNERDRGMICAACEHDDVMRRRRSIHLVVKPAPTEEDDINF